MLKKSKRISKNKKINKKGVVHDDSKIKKGL